MLAIRGLFSAFLFIITFAVMADTRPSCDVFFPAFEPIHVNGSLDLESVRCYDSTDSNPDEDSCSASGFTEASPVIPSDVSCGGTFKGGALTAGTVQCFNSWNKHASDISVSGDGTAVVYIKQNGGDIVVKKNIKINEGGDPDQLLIIVELKNGIFKVEKGDGRTAINAFVYIKSKNGGDSVLEENIDFAGHLTVAENLQIKKNSTYTYHSANDLTDNSFCEVIDPQPEFSCLNTFVDGATTHNSFAGTVVFEPNSFLFDNPDSELASRYVFNLNNNTSCWSQGKACNASGKAVTPLTLGTFQTTSSSNTKTVTIGRPVVIGNNNDSEYGSITIGAGGELTMSNQQSLYKIKNLDASARDTSIYLAPGDYYIENLLLGIGTRIYLSSPGDVRLFVKNTLRVGLASHINANASENHRLTLVGYDSIEFGTSVIINAKVYVRGRATLLGATHLTGAISGAFVYVSSSARINYDCAADEPISVNHYQIRHDKLGLTCATEEIDILACTNDYDANNLSCDLSNESFSLDVIVKDAANQQVASKSISFTQNGRASFDYGEVGDVTFSLANTNIVANNGTYCNDNAANSCDMTFSNAGFVFSDIDNQIAGEAFDGIEIQALEDVQGVCTSLPIDGTVNVGLAMKHDAPIAATSLEYTIDGTAIDKHIASVPSSYTNIPVQFNNEAKAVINKNIYYDAGQISLFANYDHNVAGEPSFTIEGSSNAFWVAPDHFDISASKSEGVPIDNTNTTGGTTHAAGKEFTLKIAAKNTQGDTTTNYRSSTAQIKMEYLEPINGHDAELQYSNSASVISNNTFTNALDVSFSGNGGSVPPGSYQFDDAYFLDVGVLNLGFQDAGYGDGAPKAIPTASLNIGRFIPDHFYLEESADVDNACTDLTNLTALTYMGQPNLKFSYQLQARSAKDTVTKNYQGADYSEVSFVAKNEDNDLSDRLANFAASWDEGTYQSNEVSLIYDEGVFSRDTEADGPYNNTFFAIKITDEDGVLLKDMDINALISGDCNLTSPSTCDAKILDESPSQIVFGRWVIDNSFGPETEDLSVPMRLEYLASSGQFETLVTDSCTAISNENDELTLTPEVDFYDITSVFERGESDLIILKAPNLAGAHNVEYQVPDWLKYDWDNDDVHDNVPLGVATFGRYRGNDRIIIWREVNP